MAMSRELPQAGGVEGESLVNPYSLREAVNDSSEMAHVAWLVFIGLMAYLMVAVAGVTHKDLLLETPVSLPVLGVPIPQAQFFQFAPVILVLIHLGLIAQLVLVARKTLEFDAAVSLLEPGPRRSHPLRLELHNFFFVQAIAGPQRSVVLGALLHSMSWLSLVILPVVLIVFIQLRYLPFHDIDVTWSHRIVLLVDLAMLTLIGIFMARSETSFVQAFGRNAAQRPFTVIFTSLLLALVAAFSFFVVTVPGETLDTISQRLLPQRAATSRSAEGNFSIPLLSRASDGTLFGLFHRNIFAPDTDVVGSRERQPGETSISLRYRDLRFARLERSNLAFADMARAKLDGATFNGANLTSVKLSCLDLGQVILSDMRGETNCASARDVSFDNAILVDARMRGIDLSGSSFVGAALEGAEMPLTVLTGANFASAYLDKVDLTGGAHLEGVDFSNATLRGADLTGAGLEGADLSSAQLQGAILRFARLFGADLTSADVEVADFSATRLEGAQMSGVKGRGLDLRGARIWLTVPPEGPLPLSDTSDVKLRPIEDSDLADLRSAIDRMPSEAGKVRLRSRLAPVMAIMPSRAWITSAEAERWQAIIKSQPSSDGYARELTETLVQLACKPRWATGGVATGVARRALAGHFRGTMITVYDQMRGGDCPGFKSIPKRLTQELSAAVDVARSN